MINFSAEYLDGDPRPWETCYSDLWELQQYGVGKGCENGVFEQFPDINWESKDGDCAMEQIWAWTRGLVDIPKPGFRKICRIVRNR